MNSTTEERILEQSRIIGGEALSFLKKIIRIPTENPPGRCYDEFARTATQALESLGYDVETVEIPAEKQSELVPLGEGPRFNIVAKLGNGHPSLAFDGHYDVVPAGDGWTVDPFGGLEEDGRIYGRGASDMKGGIAAQIFAVEALRRTGSLEVEKSGTITQFLVPDEETVGNMNAGTGYLVDSGYLSPSNTDFAIFTEPQGAGDIIIGHRGAIWGKVQVSGRKAHGGFPQLGVDATLKTCRLVDRIYSTLESEFANRVSTHSIFPEVGKKPSFVVGTLHSGTWMNTVADASEFWFVRRLIPEESLEDARDEILQILQDAKKDDPALDYNYSEHYATPSSVGSTKDELATALSWAVNRVKGRKPSFVLGAATFDIRFTLQVGISSLNYGPGRLELAHTTDEWLDMTELNDSIAVLALATAKLLHLNDKA